MTKIELEENGTLRRTLKGLMIPLLFALILPILCSLILGAEWSGQQVNHVPTAIVDHDNSSLSRQLIRFITNNQAFNVQKYSNTDEDIKTWMDESTIAAGVIIPKNFMSDIMTGKNTKILMVYDGSQMGMTGAVKTKINEIMSTIRVGFLAQIMEGKLGMTPSEAEHYLQPLGYTVRMLGNPAKSSANFTLQGIILNIVQASIYCFGIEVGDAIRTRSNKFKRYIQGMLVCGGIGTFTAFHALLIQVKIFKSPFYGSLEEAFLLTALNMTFIAGLGMIVILLRKRKIDSLTFTTLLIATLLLCGYSYPLIAMPPFFQKIAPYIHNYHYVIPMRDITLLNVPFDLILPHAKWLAWYVAAEILLIGFISQFKKMRSLCKKDSNKPRLEGVGEHA